ncbi:MAG: hypothetical protein GY835_14795 [bacterium]|nr:hypothetical protein [bacterium]
MRKLVFVIAALLLFAACGAVQAQSTSFIGISGDMIPVATDGDCTPPHIVEVVLNQPRQLFILAWLDNYDLDAITAAEFSIPDMPVDLGGAPLGSMNVTWTTDLFIGDINSGITLAWSSVQPGPVVLLGTVDLTDFGGYLFDNLCIAVQEAQDSGMLQLVDDEYEAFEVVGCNVTLNTVIIVPTESNTWSGIRSLY